MTNQEEGAYHRLLRFQWKNGYVPNALADLAQIVREPNYTMRKLWVRLAPCFPAESDGVRRNPRLETERKKAAVISTKRQAAGRLGGAAKPSKSRATAKQLLPESDKNTSKTQANAPRCESTSHIGLVYTRPTTSKPEAIASVVDGVMGRMTG